MNSIYHFFKSLSEEKHCFREIKKLEDFPFDESILSCKNVGQFPDMAIRLNKVNELFTGGELIELKDSNSYGVSSFNSTIPTGRKNIAKIIKSVSSIIKNQMEAAGNNIYSLPTRDVFYLIRGKKKGKIKVVLIHGSFFETIKSSELISQSFSQVMDERLKHLGIAVEQKLKDLLISIFSEQESFSKVRNVDKATVKLRFRVMTEVKKEGNILNSVMYPEILDDTLNFIIPSHSEEEEKIAIQKMSVVCGKSGMKKLRTFKLKHHCNGFFLVFQIPL